VWQSKLNSPDGIQRKKYSPAVDVWCCIVILFVLLTGYLFYEDPDTGSLKKILGTDYHLPEKNKHRWYNLVRRTFSPQPCVRVGKDPLSFD
jgi:serine/threonine protein kinase